MAVTSAQLGRSFALAVDQSCHPGPVPRIGVLSSSNIEGEDFSQSTGTSLLLGIFLSSYKLFHFLPDILAPAVNLPRNVLVLTTHEGGVLVPHTAVDLLQTILESPVSGEVTLSYSCAD